MDNTNKSIEELSSLLCGKVDEEFRQFMNEIKREPADVIVSSAYEIVWKDNINEYCRSETPALAPEQFQALLSAYDTLDRLYEEWIKEDDLNSYGDIETLLGNTADAINGVPQRFPAHKEASANETLSGADLISNLADELSRAQDLLRDARDTMGEEYGSAIDELLDDIDADLDRFFDRSDDIFSSLKGVEAETAAPTFKAESRKNIKSIEER